MLFATLNAKRLTTKAKTFLLATSYLLLATILSGCTIVGSTKPAALQITSKPEASVFLDGKHVGKTPFFSDQLREGQYFLKLSVPEATYTEKIDLTAKTLTVINRDLHANFLAQAGEILWLEPEEKGIFISSIPDDSDVNLDGKNIGKTPVLLEEVEEGEHKVELSKDGYVTREFSVKTSKNSRLVAMVTLASEIAKGLTTLPSPSPLITAYVEILKTPQGFLRVRRDPTTTSPEVGRVTPTQKYELVQEIDNWYQVKFEGKIGWISAQYTKKLSP